jgi:peptidoglycan/xylan/chitin deacetylase (PgdA/CDA1 family)
MIDAAYLARKSFFAFGRTLNLRTFAPKSMAGLGGILMLHRVSPQNRSPLGVNAGLSVTPEFLESLVAALKADGYDFIALDDVPQRLAKPQERPFLAVTFDDGYKDNAEHAYPVLRRHNAPWTVYIAPGLVNGDTFLWWELLELALIHMDEADGPFGRISCSSAGEKAAAFARIAHWLLHECPETEVPAFVRNFAGRVELDAAGYGLAELLDWPAIRALSKDPLCTIGTHTMRHFHLARLSLEQLDAEFAEAHQALVHETGLEPRHVAYPYGYRIAVGRREAEEASKRSYKTGVTTRHGMLFQGHAQDITALPRISLNGLHQNTGDVRLMLSGITGLLTSRRIGPVPL